MLITLTGAQHGDRIRAWLTRLGFEARVVQRGQALLVQDPWMPWGVKDALSSDPGVACLDETQALPQRVLRQGPQDEALDAWHLGEVPVIAGPCAVEDPDMIGQAAAFCASLGIRWLRGGTDKTRTRVDAFQGLGARGAAWLREAADAHGMKVVTEVTDTPEAEAIAAFADVLMVGARHMHASRHLQRVGRIGKPVILKRGLAASPEEWLRAAEYLLEAGAPSVAFCERGSRSANPLKRFTLDLAAVPFIREMSAFPVLVDPSHAAGYSPYVAPLARAAIAAGAHGVVVECHPDPACARSDALQALDFQALAALVTDLRRLQAVTQPGSLSLPSAVTREGATLEKAAQP
ncbi:MAG: 3-deoxy-7-phosphoheptulonate synthase [Candidatus Sericytochromatia bacterium]|nr:3-deoxy-7-phosphoheptulonate synthase [Candidatus Sericytochromatia bacterium]